MLVSHSKKFIYIKTTKTAGTSVEMALQHHCVPAGTPIGEITDCLESSAGIVGARGPDVSGQPWFNHMSAQAIRNKLPADVWNGYCKICNIRNPWDKTVSFFHMAFPKIKNEAPADIFEAFRSWIAEADKLGSDTKIYFIDNTPVADEYIRYHTLTEDLHRISEKLGLDVPDLPEAKTEQRGQNKLPYQDYYDAAGRQKVSDIYHREIDHFGWTFD
ncbi:MAG: hypothetical protein QNJ09_00840 [Paracoccaceae bacterium]|nr:hypothetical protein [Paracoccaceae bacterium]